MSNQGNQVTIDPIVDARDQPPFFVVWNKQKTALLLNPHTGSLLQFAAKQDAIEASKLRDNCVAREARWGNAQLILGPEVRGPIRYFVTISVLGIPAEWKEVDLSQYLFLSTPDDEDLYTKTDGDSFVRNGIIGCIKYDGSVPA